MGLRYQPSKSVGKPDIILAVFSIGPYANFERGNQVGSGGMADLAFGRDSHSGMAVAVSHCKRRFEVFIATKIGFRQVQSFNGHSG